MSNVQMKKADDALREIAAEDLVKPIKERMQKTSPSREWQIRKLQEKLGVSREIAEKMVDESSPPE